MKRRPLLAVVGDAGVSDGNPAYEHARTLGRLAVDAGMRVVSGGLGGVMEAALRGAHESARYHEGDTLAILPHPNPAEANAWADIVIASGLDHARNSLVANCDAMVAVGGGAGTLSEIAFAWMYRRLIVAIVAPGWSETLAGQRLDHRERYPDIPDDCVYRAANAQEAIDLVSARLPAYSRRHVGFARRDEGDGG